MKTRNLPPPTKVLTNRPRLSEEKGREAFFPLGKTMRVVTPSPLGASDDAMERKKHEPFFDRAYVPHRRRKHRRAKREEPTNAKTAAR